MPRLVMLVMLLACMTGCSLAEDASAESARRIVDVIVANHLGALSWAIAWRSLLGGVIGLGLGLGVFFGVRQLKGFRWDWEHAKWVRGLTGTAYGLTFAGALGWYGFWNGMVQGTEQVVVEGQLATDVLPAVGEAGSTLLAVVYVGGEVVCEQDQALDQDQQAALAAKLDGYVAGGWDMDVEILRARIADVRSCVLALGVDEAKRQVYERYPRLAGTAADDLVPWALDRLADMLVASLAESEQVGVYAKPIVDMLAGLDEAAAHAGEPAALSHQELSDHVVAVAVIPMIMMPVEHVAASQKQAGLFAVLALLALSIGLFQLAHFLYERQRGGSSMMGS